jgi:hypothetical protein
VLRLLDPAERYYWLLDQLGPMSIVASARLGRRLDPSDLAQAIAVVQRAHPLLRARITVVDGAPAFVEAAGALPSTVVPLEDEDGLAALEGELDLPFSDGLPLARCQYLSSPHEERSVLRLAVHHAVADARAAIAALQQILRCVDGGVGTAPMPEGDLLPLHDRFPPDLQAPATRRDIARQIRAEREQQAPAATFSFHARHVTERHTRLDRLALEHVATSRLRDDARARGATVQGALGAAVLESSAALLDDTARGPITLLTPTDLRRRIEPALEPEDVQLAIGVLCTPYETGAREPDLARRISEQIHREVDRGEGHLFYRIVRAAGYGADETGLEAFRKWMASVPQNVAVSNLGVVTENGDPSWVESISFALATSPNQVAFAAATTYRDRLVVDVTSDRAKLPPWAAERLVSGIAERIGAERVGSGGQRL